MKSISQGQKSPFHPKAVPNTTQVHLHEIYSWFALNMNIQNPDEELDDLPELRLKENLFTM